MAVEDMGGDGFGRIRLHRIPDASGSRLLGFVKIDCKRIITDALLIFPA